jgi:hypothetical protein
MDLLLFCSAGLPELLPARRHLLRAAHAAGDVLLLLLLLMDTTPGALQGRPTRQGRQGLRRNHRPRQPCAGVGTRMPPFSTPSHVKYINGQVLPHVRSC